MLPSGAGAPLECSLCVDLGHAKGTEPPNWSRQQTNPRPSTWGFNMERVTRIELALSAWEAWVFWRQLPYLTCDGVVLELWSHP